MSLEVPYIAGDFTAATPVGLPEFSAPFPGLKYFYVITQKWMQLESQFVPLRLNTEHPSYVDYILVEESPLQDRGGGVVEWTRTYAIVPQSYNEPGGSYNYSFIGFYGVFGINVTNVTGRDRYTKSVPVKVQRDFFLVDEAVGPLFDWSQIPIIEAQRYFYAGTPHLDVDFLADSPPFTTATTPSRSEYLALVAANQYIVAETSRISRWKGNIYQRETLYIKAQ